MNRFIKVIAIIIILGAVFYLGFNYRQNKVLAPVSENNNQQPSANAAAKEKISLMLDFGNGDIRTFTDVDFTANQNSFDFLKRTTEKNNIELIYKDYGGDLGIFIESIGGVKNNANQWWQYWVNGKYSEKGAGSYILQPGDLIEFKFVKGQIAL